MKLLSVLLMKTRFVLCSFLFISLALHASKKPDTDTFTVNIKYSGKLSLSNYPVVVSLKGYPWVSCSSVYFNDKELPSQLDDLDGDGINDEMCFLAELKGGQTYNYKVVLKKQGTQKTYASRTYAELLLRNPKIKEKNKQDLYIQQIEVGKRSFTRRKSSRCKDLETIFYGLETAWAWVHSVDGTVEKSRCWKMLHIEDSA